MRLVIIFLCFAVGQSCQKTEKKVDPFPLYGASIFEQSHEAPLLKGYETIDGDSIFISLENPKPGDIVFVWLPDGGSLWGFNKDMLLEKLEKEAF